MNILVTGMSGLIGTALRGVLEGRGELRALNRSDVPGISTTRADLSDYDAIRPAFDGREVVVHLAAKAGESFTWDELLQTNVVGTRNVFEAAKDAGCKRVVFASSGATVSGWEQNEPYRSLVQGTHDGAGDWPMITVDAPTRPSGVYGSTKVWGEAYARHVTDTSPISIINVRIGYVNKEDRPSSPRHFAVWCSQRDVVDMLVRCIDAPGDMKHETVFVNSDNRFGYRDLEHSKALLGFEPQDAAEDHRT